MKERKVEAESLQPFVCHYPALVAQPPPFVISIPTQESLREKSCKAEQIKHDLIINDLMRKNSSNLN